MIRKLIRVFQTFIYTPQSGLKPPRSNILGPEKPSKPEYILPNRVLNPRYNILGPEKPSKPKTFRPVKTQILKTKVASRLSMFFGVIAEGLWGLEISGSQGFEV